VRTRLYLSAWRRRGTEATSGCGIYLSTDAGRRFRRVARVAGVSAVAFDLRNYLVAYAALDRTLLRSADGGVTWQLPG